MKNLILFLFLFISVLSYSQKTVRESKEDILKRHNYSVLKTQNTYDGAEILTFQTKIGFDEYYLMDGRSVILTEKISNDSTMFLEIGALKFLYKQIGENYFYDASNKEYIKFQVDTPSGYSVVRSIFEIE